MPAEQLAVLRMREYAIANRTDSLHQKDCMPFARPLC